jgi:hypothetical protein
MINLELMAIVLVIKIIKYFSMMLFFDNIVDIIFFLINP